MDEHDLIFFPHGPGDGDTSKPKLDVAQIGEGEDEAITLDQRFGSGWYGVIPASSATSKEQTPDLPQPDHNTPVAHTTTLTATNELGSGQGEIETAPEHLRVRSLIPHLAGRAFGLFR